MALTFKEHAARIEVLAKRLDRVAYRLRQGAITNDSAAAELHAVADELTQLEANT